MQSHLFRAGHLSTQNLSNASNIALDRFELFQIYFQHWVLDYDSRDGYTIKEFEFFVLELGEENSIVICLFNKISSWNSRYQVDI